MMENEPQDHANEAREEGSRQVVLQAADLMKLIDMVNTKKQPLVEEARIGRVDEFSEKELEEALRGKRKREDPGSKPASQADIMALIEASKAKDAMAVLPPDLQRLEFIRQVLEVLLDAKAEERTLRTLVVGVRHLINDLRAKEAWPAAAKKLTTKLGKDCKPAELRLATIDITTGKEEAMASRKPQNCFACGQLGHTSRNCQAKTAMVAASPCPVCHKMGHGESACWTAHPELKQAGGVRFGASKMPVASAGASAVSAPSAHAPGA